MRRPRNIVKLAGLAMAVAILGGTLFAGLNPASRSNQATVQHLRNLRELDTQVSLLLMRVRHGLLTNYDPIVQATQTIEAASRRLLDKQPGPQAGEAAGIAAAREVAAQTIRAKMLAIEDFKSSFAVLRSSISLLSVLAADLAEVAPRTEMEIETYRRANALLLALSRLMVGAGGEALHAVDSGRAALAASPTTPGPLAETVGKVLVISRVVQLTRTEADERIAELMNLPVGARLGDLIAAYGRQNDRIEVARQALELAVGVVALMSLLMALRGLRARRSARLALEQRVEERTRDLAESNAALTRSSRARTDFLAKMSHDIRTPLAAILGFADLLEDQRLRLTERRSIAHVIRRNGEHLLATLDDILEITKIEGGKLTVEAIPCSPRHIVEEVCALLRHRAEAKSILLTIQIVADALPGWIESDPTRLRLILVNLLGNAIKMAALGPVSVALSTVPRSSLWLRVEFRDGGGGMTPEETELAASRRLAAVLGGEISVQSPPGEGTTLTLLLPVTAVADAPADPDPPVLTTQRGLRPRSGLRVLVADSSADVRLLVTRVLDDIDAEVAVVSDGRQAVEAALTASREGRAFDIILMDLHTPELDGARALQVLRAAGLIIPMIALAAHDSPEDRERCARAGYLDFLTKPVDGAQLIQKIAILSGAREGKTETGPTPAPAAPEGDTAESAPPSLFDADRLLEMVGGDQSVRDFILTIFQKDAPDLLQSIQSAVSHTDAAAIRAAARKLKGMLLTVGAHRAAATASALESSAAAAETDRLDLLVRALVADLTSVCQSMVVSRSNPTTVATRTVAGGGSPSPHPSEA